MIRKIFWISALMVLALTGCKYKNSGKNGSPNSVHTLNTGYSRTASHVLVREVNNPTRARLDYAAYSGNIMLWDPAADTVRLSRAPTESDFRFDGLLSDFRKTAQDLPLTSAEREAPLQWKPALDFLLEQSFDSTRSLADAYGKATSERWGFTGDAPPLIEFTDLYLSAKDSTAWVKIELKSWVRPVPEVMIVHEGFPEIYAHISASQFTRQLFSILRGDYSTRVLSESELIDYGHQLAAYWYPSRNTDFQDLRGRGSWPGENVEADVRAELKGLSVAQPLFALRGKPHGQPVYFVLSVPGMGTKHPVDSAASTLSPATPTRAVADNLGEYLSSIRDRETALLADAGKGSWEKWNSRMSAFHADVSSVLKSQPPTVMALKGRKDFLLFRRELEYLLADDLQKLPKEKNPVEAIVALRDSLASLGIDFLFVPIPTKQDVYPDIVSKTGSKLPGNTAQPWLRKLLLDLSSRQVETLDLLTAFQDSARGAEPLYQRQDTHWTSRGLQLAARTLAERVMSYVWFGEAYAKETSYTTRDTIFSQLGDLYDRLPADARSGLGPEKLNARQVFLDGKPYEDSPDAPVLVLGDSYTGVYELTGCRHAGVSAQLAKAISGPVDLIMGWGGGPEACNKLRRAGPNALKGKRLVIWMMSARDLFVYPGGWSN